MVQQYSLVVGQLSDTPPPNLDPRSGGQNNVNHPDLRQLVNDPTRLVT